MIPFFVSPSYRGYFNSCLLVTKGHKFGKHVPLVVFLPPICYPRDILFICFQEEDDGVPNLSECLGGLNGAACPLVITNIDKWGDGLDLLNGFDCTGRYF